MFIQFLTSNNALEKDFSNINQLNQITILSHPLLEQQQVIHSSSRGKTDCTNAFYGTQQPGKATPSSYILLNGTLILNTILECPIHQALSHLFPTLSSVS
jgi:hypothetical protein